MIYSQKEISICHFGAMDDSNIHHHLISISLWHLSFFQAALIFQFSIVGQFLTGSANVLRSKLAAIFARGRFNQFLWLSATFSTLFCQPQGHIFCTEIEILKSGSRDISQKLRQTKCMIFRIWRLKCTIIQKKKLFCTWQFGKIGVLVNLIIQKLKSKHLVCLSFWDMSCDPEFRILISVQKMWPYGSSKSAKIVLFANRKNY